MANDSLLPDDGGAIAEVIASFLDAVRSAAPAMPTEERAAELFYELDQAVSLFLEDHQLSPELHHELQQDVLQGLAARIQQQSDDQILLQLDPDPASPLDAADVLAAVNDRWDAIANFDDALQPDSALFHDSADSMADGMGGVQHLDAAICWDPMMDLPSLG